MIINKIAIGNKFESYIEKTLTDGFNIISSDDNNKGKTIVIQALMYALGNSPTFPQSFEYKKYIYYVEFEHENETYYIARSQNSFTLKAQSKIIPFDNISDLKRYWTKNIFPLPVINKDDAKHIVYPELFLQLFFLGQDKKTTNELSSTTFYKKKDFENMLYSMVLHEIILEDNSIEIQKANKDIDSLKEERRYLIKQHKILNSKTSAAKYLSRVADDANFDEKIENIKKIVEKINILRNEKNKYLGKKSRWEETLKAINSLNMGINTGMLYCMDCSSTNIHYKESKKSDFTFDLSTVEMRTNFKNSLQEKIDACDEEITEIDMQINQQREKQNESLENENITLEMVVEYKRPFLNAVDTEKRIIEIDLALKSLSDYKDTQNDKILTKKTEKSEILEAIVTQMQYFCDYIDSTNNLSITDLFTKRDVVFSGSQGTIFHLAKLYALQIVTKHTYPIIIDSFRAEDLSSENEKKVVELFKGINNQRIFTTTLKDEELGKYKNLPGIHDIDYSVKDPSKILNESYNEEFKFLISELSLIL